jgi:3-oxoadipate enol-lactonase
MEANMIANLRGIEIGFDSYGEGPATLVLLHAFPLNRQQWRDQGAVLARAADLRVVAPDLRGFGESSLEIGPSTVEQMAGDTLALMDSLGIDAFALCGLSLGGYVAFEIVRQARRRLQGLILADTRATADTPEQRQAREDTAAFVEAHGPEALLLRDASRLLGQPTRDRRPEVIEEARRIVALNSDIGVAAASRGMGLRPDSTETLLDIHCPTLILVGAQDVITPEPDAQAMAERIVNAGVEVIAEAGHLSNLEQPDLFTSLVAQFAQRLYGVTLGQSRAPERAGPQA